MDELEFVRWKRRTLEWRVAFELRERDRLRAQVEAEEIHQEELRAELERTQEKVRRWLEQAPAAELGKPN